MATSGQFFESCGSYYEFYIYWEVTGQDIAANTSRVYLSWGLRKKASNSSSYNYGAKLWAQYASTSLKSGSTVTFDMRSSSVGTEKSLYNTTITVPHNADGTKQLYVYGYFDPGNVSGASAAEIGKYITLPTIPRATTPTLSKSSADMGTGIIIYTTGAAASTFTHDLSYTLPNGTTGAIKTGVGATSTSWTVPNFASSIPKATSGSVTVTCITRDSSGTAIGTKTVSLTATVPASVVPSVSAVSVSEGTSGIAAQFGAYIQNKSKLVVSVTAVGASGSTISSVSTVIEGRTYSGTGFTSNVITGSGTLSIVVKVQDSRGRTATKTVTVSVLAYSPPTISALNAWRVDTSGAAVDDGSRAAIQYSYSAPSLNSKNTVTATIQYKKSSDVSWSTLRSTSGISASTTYKPTTELSADYRWDIRLQVKDWFGATTTATVQIPTAEVILDFNASGNGLGIGKVSEADGVDIAWKMLNIPSGGINTESLTASGAVQFKGSVRLKNDTNYGMKLNFGDGELVYISEPVDDHLEIHASHSIRFTGMDMASVNPLPINQGGTGATTAAAALTKLGAASSWKLLWTNGSPSSSFAAQTLTISGLSNYNLFTIVAAYSNTYSTHITGTTVYIPGTGNMLVHPSVIWYSSYISATYRIATVNRGSNTVQFGIGCQVTHAATTDSANYCIPLYILGSNI